MRARRAVDAADAELGERVRQRRLALRLSARVLAEAIGVSQQQVCRYETGADRMTVSTLLRICSALDMSVAAVCEGLDKPRT